MSQAFADRPPTGREVERLRLLLSTYQDGTGMRALKGGTTLPGWRDFERAAALAFGGVAQESKAIFDVLIPLSDDQRVRFGLSCKMRGELDKVSRAGRVSIELSNSAKKFWSYLEAKEIDQTNYRDRPAEVGAALIGMVESWHHAVSIEQGGSIDLSKSSYLVLSWNPAGNYQLHQFPLALPEPSGLHWHYPAGRGGRRGARLAADDGSGIIFEWYGESGGQLKFYPQAASAIWASEIFQLEPLGNGEYGVMKKAEVYFPQKWARAREE